MQRDQLQSTRVPIPHSSSSGQTCINCAIIHRGRECLRALLAPEWTAGSFDPRIPECQSHHIEGVGSASHRLAPLVTIPSDHSPVPSRYSFVPGSQVFLITFGLNPAGLRILAC
ncbi:hypothetical protein AB1N83_012572 [Pleurotus pulmonarius]